MASVCVFCGAKGGDDPAYIPAAASIGKRFAAAGLTLIYGGGSVGMMGAVADACLAADGDVIGVIPQSLATIELMHPGVSDMRVVADMHARKAMMHQLSDAYVALPGGYGTLEELFEVLCWAQLSFHQSPVLLVNQDGFYDGLVTLVDQMMSRDFLDANSRQLLNVMASADDAATWIIDNLN